MVEAARQGEDPFVAGAVLDRAADPRAGIRRHVMVLEVVELAVVETGEMPRLGRRNPVAVFVVDEDALDALADELTLLQERLQLGDRDRPHAIPLQPIDQSDQNRVDLLEHVFRVLGQGAGQVGHFHFGILEFGVAGFPFAPGAQRQDCDAAERDKSRCPQRQPGFA
jgi:hypothetical protein